MHKRLVIKNMKSLLTLAFASVVSSACASSPIVFDNNASKSMDEQTTRVVLASDVKWGALNPARRDKGPKAATLWGDRSGAGPSGFLVKFVDGFSSPPHIHNVSYRGVVISGLIHNDDPEAADMWLPAGSFWTQPKGEAHITAAKGSHNLAYIEIEQGPYLVLPKEEAFDSGERPVNIDESNMVWLDASNITWINQPGIPVAANKVKLAFLWGKPQGDQLNGTLVKLPAGLTANINSQGSTFHAVVIQGQAQYRVSETEMKTLEPGSHFSSQGESVHQVSTASAEESIIYVRSAGKFDIIPTQSGK